MGLFSGLGSLLGIGGGQGEHYKATALQNKGTKSLAEMLDAARGDKVNNAGQGLVGGKSLAESLKGLNGDETAGLASSPIYGNNIAEQQVMSDPLLAGTFGAGGSREKAMGEESRLRDQGFQLTPEDHEAYGQASGNVARMFGQQEQSLASALANRGLSAAPSGAAGAQFTGLQGNKNEQLGRMQMDIANQRMQNTMQRLQQTRSYIGQLNSQGLQAEGQMFNNNLAGAKERTGLANNLASNERADWEGQQRADQASMASKNENKEQNIFDIASRGLAGGLQGGITSAVGNVFAPKQPAPAAKPIMSGDTKNLWDKA